MEDEDLPNNLFNGVDKANQIRQKVIKYLKDLMELKQVPYDKNKDGTLCHTLKLEGMSV